MKSVLVLITLFATSAFATAPVETKEFDAKGLKSVSIENEAGNVSVTGTDSATATVTITKNKYTDKCTTSIERRGNGLVIEIDKHEGLFSKAGCDVDVSVSLPRKVNVDLMLGSGDFKLNNTDGDLAFKVGTGSVLADGSFNKVNGTTGNGKIEVKGLRGGGEVKSGMGEVILTYATSPKNGDLDLKIGNGNATINLPKGSLIKTDLQSGMGQISNDLKTDANAKFKVSMKSDMGDLNVKSY